MNESEWLACEDPDAMLKFLGKKYSPRKLRLFACACCRSVWPLFSDRGRRAVEVAELFADGRASVRELDEAGDAADDGAPGMVEQGAEYNPAFWATLRNAFKAATQTWAYAAGWAVGRT